jgi:IS5 family transposase
VNIARGVSHLFNKTILIGVDMPRDLMFRRFIDLSLSEAVPDHATIWRFRQLLNTENLLEPLLEQINHHLEQNSIIVSLILNIIMGG